MAEGIDAVKAQVEVLDWLKNNVPDYWDAMVTSMGAEAGFRDKQLDQAWKIASLNESGANARARMSAAASSRNAEIAAGASRANAKLAAETQRYGIDTDRLTAQEKLALEGELGRGRLGLDYLSAASQMRGPDNYLQMGDFLRGASARQDVPIFLQNLMNGGTNAAFQAPGGAPAGFNAQGLMAKLGGGPAGGAMGPTGQDNSFLQAARGLAQRGFHTLQPGTLERLRPAELGALKSAVEYSGDGGPAWSWDDLLGVYRGAGIGQGSAMAA